MAHTPGPWDCDEGDFTIYELDGMKPIDFGYAPNARLIAAAPDLLVALKAVLEWAGEIAGDNQDDESAALEDYSIDMARAAIAKAEGAQK